MARRTDELSPIARAQFWVSKILTIVLLMVAPGLVGWWIDERAGTRVLFMLLGFAVGWAAAFWLLLHLKDSGPDATHGEDTHSKSP